MTAQSRYAMWDLRHPIDMGRIFEGRELGRALRSHAETFTTITSVPAELTQRGEEPPMSVEAKGLLFSIAHNAPHQRIPPCGGEQGFHRAGVWKGRPSAFGVGRWRRPSGQL